MSYPGFPSRVRYTPVPNPLFGPILEQIDGLAELKCTLRVIWLLHQKRGFPRFVSLGDVLADRTLLNGMGPGGGRSEIEAALDSAVRRGTLVSGTLRRDGVEERRYALNTEADRRALAKVAEGDFPAQSASIPETPEPVADRPNIFALYEDNIGSLSPMIAEELKEAEQLYPASWLEDAFREAVGQNKRSWRYIARILERWDREGRSNGRARGHTKKAGRF
jgi:DNA replication protein